MKKAKFKIIVPVLASGALILAACSKSFLEKAPLGALEPGTVANGAGVQKLLIGAYSALDGFGVQGAGWQAAASNWVYGGVASDDAYKGSDPGDQADIVPIETYQSNSANGYFNQKWQAVYDGVQRANDVIRNMRLATDMTPEDTTTTVAQARFLRAHFHFEAMQMWGKVPYIDESISYSAGNWNQPNPGPIWDKIEADLTFAKDNLPESWGTAVGRANKWAAQVYLAKVYMFQNKYQQALPLLNDAITNGVNSGGKKYKLVNYSDNFNAETKNSAETVFSVQQSVNDASNGGNGGWGDVLNFPYNGGPGTCCGFYQPSQSLVNSFRVDANGLPYLDTWNDVDVKNDQGLKSTDPFTPETAPLDARLDWTVGRRGIPYLDWGPHPGNDWIRDQNNGGPYSPIKNVYYKRQQGALTDNNFWTAGVTANNYTFIRFAEVLLWAAECEVEVGSLENARALVNQVRTRAADKTGWVKDSNGNPAANYSVGLYNTAWTDQATARKAVRFELKIETGMEGKRFFALQRWDKQTPGYMADVLNAYIAKEKARRTFFTTAQFTKGKNEVFPIPQSQIDLSKGVLVQNPGY